MTTPVGGPNYDFVLVTVSMGNPSSPSIVNFHRFETWEAAAKCAAWLTNNFGKISVSVFPEARGG